MALGAAAPRVSTEAARGLGVVEEISTFTTRHPCCQPRVTNIHAIADIVDGYVVLPGETFSLNTVVGERDTARGFVAAPMISAGKYEDSVGGGISQFATTMFNAVFFAGLEDVQHKPHSYWISRYPAGRESTVSFPQPDFRWRNDSGHGVLVRTVVHEHLAHGLVLGHQAVRRGVGVGTPLRRHPGGDAVRHLHRLLPAAGGGGLPDRRHPGVPPGRQGGPPADASTPRYLSEPHIVCGPAPAPSPTAPPSPSAAPSPSAPPSPSGRPSPGPTRSPSPTASPTTRPGPSPTTVPRSAASPSSSPVAAPLS